MEKETYIAISAAVTAALVEVLDETQQNIPYEKVAYSRKDIEERYGVSEGVALQIMREARFLCGGEGYNGKLGKTKLHYSELAVWDNSISSDRRKRLLSGGAP